MLVDPMHLETYKSVYYPGDTVSIQTSICRNRDYSARTTWRLFNETVITYPSQVVRILSRGCLRNKWFPVATIPPCAINGTHHLEAVTEIRINPLQTLTYTFSSVVFEVHGLDASSTIQIN